MAEIAILKQNFNAINNILDKHNIKNNEFISHSLFGTTEKELSKRFDGDKNGILDENEKKNLSIFKASIIQSKFDINRDYNLDTEEIATFANYIENLKKKQLKENITNSNENLDALISGIDSMANDSDWKNAQESIEKLSIPDSKKKLLLERLIGRIQTNKIFERNLNILKTSLDDGIKENIINAMSDAELLAINPKDMAKTFSNSCSYFAISEDDKTIGTLIKRINKIAQNPLYKSGIYFDTTSGKLELSQKPTDISKQSPYDIYKAWYQVKKEQSEESALGMLSTAWNKIQMNLN